MYFAYDLIIRRTEISCEFTILEKQLWQIAGDMFTAGQETVKTTVQWAILYMLYNPKIARRVQAELDSVVGRGRLPNLDDRENLPYTMATINEIFRRSSVVGLGVHHQTTR